MKWVLLLGVLVGLAKCRTIFDYEKDGLDNEQHGVPGKSVTGQYEWRSPDGKVTEVSYIADHLGFRLLEDLELDLPTEPFRPSEITPQASTKNVDDKENTVEGENVEPPTIKTVEDEEEEEEDEGEEEEEEEEENEASERENEDEESEVETEEEEEEEEENTEGDASAKETKATEKEADVEKEVGGETETVDNENAEIKEADTTTTKDQVNTDELDGNSGKSFDDKSIVDNDENTLDKIENDVPGEPMKQSITVAQSTIEVKDDVQVIFEKESSARSPDTVDIEIMEKPSLVSQTPVLVPVAVESPVNVESTVAFGKSLTKESPGVVMTELTDKKPVPITVVEYDFIDENPIFRTSKSTNDMESVVVTGIDALNNEQSQTEFSLSTKEIHPSEQVYPMQGSLKSTFDDVVVVGELSADPLTTGDMTDDIDTLSTGPTFENIVVREVIDDPIATAEIMHVAEPMVAPVEQDSLSDTVFHSLVDGEIMSLPIATAEIMPVAEPMVSPIEVKFAPPAIDVAVTAEMIPIAEPVVAYVKGSLASESSNDDSLDGEQIATYPIATAEMIPIAQPMVDPIPDSLSLKSTVQDVTDSDVVFLGPFEAPVPETYDNFDTSFDAVEVEITKPLKQQFDATVTFEVDQNSEFETSQNLDENSPIIVREIQLTKEVVNPEGEHRFELTNSGKAMDSIPLTIETNREESIKDLYFIPESFQDTDTKSPQPLLQVLETPIPDEVMHIITKSSQTEELLKLATSINEIIKPVSKLSIPSSDHVLLTDVEITAVEPNQEAQMTVFGMSPPRSILQAQEPDTFQTEVIEDIEVPASIFDSLVPSIYSGSEIPATDISSTDNVHYIEVQEDNVQMETVGKNIKFQAPPLLPPLMKVSRILN